MSTAIPPGHELLEGRLYMRDAKGSLIPANLVKASDKLMDELVRKLVWAADEKSKRLAAFKSAAFDDIDAFLQLLASEHKVEVGGVKGNITLYTIDGLMKVQVAVADRFEWGPKLQIAKAAIDVCLRDWGAHSRPELQAIIEQAFKVDKEGKVNSAALLGLARLDIQDGRWLEAMRALRESMTTVGSSRYVRFYQRQKPDAPWGGIGLDIARV